MTIKVCEYCGQEFQSRATWKRFCSRACFKKAINYRLKNPLPGPSPKYSFWEETRHWQKARRSELNRLKAREEFRAKCEEYDWKCAYCGCGLDETTVQRDHVIPFLLGGSNDIPNIVPACQDCNSNKSYKSVWQWRCDRKRKQNARQGRLK